MTTTTAGPRVPWSQEAEVRDRPDPVALPSLGTELPRWPLAVLLYGFPVVWVLGMAQFVPTLLSLVMLGYLAVRGRIRMAPGMWAWAFLLVWVIACTVMLEKNTDVIAWGLRFSVLFNAGVCALYVLNARSTVSTDFVLRGICVVWWTVVVLGNVSLLLPDLRLTTPMALVMPHGLMENDLVHDYVAPRLTETQTPWGAPAAYVRPAAPFPYANSWGLALALTTPVAIARILRSRSNGVRVVHVLGLLASAVPAVASSNRGMLLGLAVSVVFVILRLAFRGRGKATVLGLAVLLLAVGALVGSGALGRILGRQQYSHSTDGRGNLYGATLEWALRSPLFGYGTTRMNDTIGVSMGTQGYLWTLMFCFGFVGMGFFLWFLVSSLLRLWRTPGTAGLWLLSTLLVTLGVLVVYSFDTMQMAIVLLNYALLTRAKRDGEVL